MKSVEQILTRLESLASADRQWIVARLPDHAKSLLMDELTSTNAKARIAAAELAGEASNNDQLEKISPAVAAAILGTESVWVIATLLQSASRDWAALAMNLLPATLRSSVVISMRDLRPAPRAVTASLRNTLLKRAAMEYSSITPEETKSWWRQMMRTMRGAAT